MSFIRSAAQFPSTRGARGVLFIHSFAQKCPCYCISNSTPPVISIRQPAERNLKASLSDPLLSSPLREGLGVCYLYIPPLKNALATAFPIALPLSFRSASRRREISTLPSPLRHSAPLSERGRGCVIYPLRCSVPLSRGARGVSFIRSVVAKMRLLPPPTGGSE